MYRLKALAQMRNIPFEKLIRASLDQAQDEKDAESDIKSDNDKESKLDNSSQINSTVYHVDNSINSDRVSERKIQVQVKNLDADVTSQRQSKIESSDNLAEGLTSATQESKGRRMSKKQTVKSDEHDGKLYQ